MRKFLPQFLLVTIALVGVGFFFAPHWAWAQAASNTSSGGGFWSGLLDISNWSLNFFYGLFGKAILVFSNVTGWLVWLVGQMVDFAIVVGLDKTLYTSDALRTGWSIIRDLCNMIFIFVLIWAGLKTILNLGNAVSVKKTLTGVVIAAIFINFSFFITQAVIDVSNIGTLWFVQGVQSVGGGTGVSDSVRAVLKMEKLVEKTNDDIKNQGLSTFVAAIAIVVMNCVAIYVLFSVAFFLIARIVAFMFLLITSPIGFLRWVEMPYLEDYAKKWWDELRKNALMAPMFFLMLYLTLFIVDRINDLAVTASKDPVSGSAFGPSNYVMFAIIIMMLLKSLETAKEYSGELGGKIAGVFKSATTFAASGMLMGTVGKAATALQGSKSFQSWSARNGLLGEMAMKATTGTSGAKFGVSSGYKDLKLDKLGIPGTSDAFKGSEKGYAGAVKKEADDYKKYAKDNLGKGAAGAMNRKVFAEGLKKRSTGFGLTSTGASIGASIGSGGGIPGIIVGGVIGGIAGRVLNGKVSAAVQAQAAKGGMVNDVIGGIYGDKGKFGAGNSMTNKDNTGDADKEYIKEAGKAIQEAKEEIYDSNLELRQLEEEQKQINQEIEQNKARIPEALKQKTQERDSLKEEEAKLGETMKTYDTKSKTIGGLAVGSGAFDQGFQKVQNNLSSIRNRIAQKEQEMKADPSEAALQKIRQWAAETKIRAKKDEVAKKALEKAKSKGVKISTEDENYEGMMRLIKKGDKVSGEENTAKISKLVEDADKLVEKAEKPDEPKPKEEKKE